MRDRERRAGRIGGPGEGIRPFCVNRVVSSACFDVIGSRTQFYASFRCLFPSKSLCLRGGPFILG